MAVFSGSIIDRFKTVSRRRLLQQFIVSVQEQNSMLRQAILYGKLFSEYILLGPQLFNMGNSDIGNDRHLNLGYAGDDRQLSRFAHPQFDHTDLILPGYLRHGDRNADLAVVIGGCLVDAVSGRQGTGHHLPCRRLSHASGDSNQRQL